MVLPGFNTDFKYNGLVYHAQTEDNGVNNPVIVTLLYLRGAILASKKSSYQELVGTSDCSRQVMERMKDQHRNIMKEVLAGKYDVTNDTGSSEAAPPQEAPAVVGEEPKSLDQAIMDFLDGFDTGTTPAG